MSRMLHCILPCFGCLIQQTVLDVLSKLTHNRFVALGTLLDLEALEFFIL